MKVLAIGPALLLLVEIFSEVGVAPRVETVHFLEGETLVMKSGTISGHEVVKYVFGAAAGQAISVRLIPASDACAMRVSMPGADEHDFADVRQGDEYIARHARPGRYAAHIHLTRSGARRGETCAYSVSIKLNDDTGLLEAKRRKL